MTIDFHSREIKGTYASRTASKGWFDAMREILDPRGLTMADIGCGGGIYSRAWSDLGADRVIGVDFSDQMVADATAASRAYTNVSFSQGDATATELPSASMDIIFERALIHHLADLESAFSEAFRILKPGGTIIVQDRTLRDVLQPASPEHFRGFFFEVFPHLLDTERGRRPNIGQVKVAMHNAGFRKVATTSVPEVRRIYESPRELEHDLRARTGRSILHALNDAELSHLITTILHRVSGSFPLRETDHWTIWTAPKPE